MTRPKKLKRVGTAGPARGRLPRMLPTPTQRPKFVVEAGESGGLDAAGNYVHEHVVRSPEPLDKFSRKHELFHTLDYDEFDLPTRMAVARIVAPRRANEVVDDASWWGETGMASGGRPGIAEIAADYYAAAATKAKLRRRLPGGIVVADQDSAYVDKMRPKRLGAFRTFMDEWARDRMYGDAPVAPPQASSSRKRKRLRKRP